MIMAPKAKAPAKRSSTKAAKKSAKPAKAKGGKSAAKPAAKSARKSADKSKSRVKPSRMKKTASPKKPSSRTPKKAAKPVKKAAPKKAAAPKKSAPKKAAPKKAVPKKPAPKKAAPKKAAQPARKKAAPVKAVKAAKAPKINKKVNGSQAIKKVAPTSVLKPPIGESVSVISTTPAAALKPKKRKKSPLSSKQLAKLRAILLQEKERLKSEIEQMEELTNSSKNGDSDIHPGYSTHIAEYATDSQFIETSFVQLAYLQRQLNEVRQALERIDDGSYGICQGSGNPIPLKRLEAKPTARYSIEYRKKFESGLL